MDNRIQSDQEVLDKNACRINLQTCRGFRKRAQLNVGAKKMHPRKKKDLLSNGEHCINSGLGETGGTLYNKKKEI